MRSNRSRRKRLRPRVTASPGLGLLAILLANLLLGCSTSGEQRAGTRTSELADAGSSPATPATAGELPKGINDHFLSSELDVEKYVERFEGESRAVYAERHAIVAALGLRPGDDIADIGAGTGFFSFLFAEAVAPGGTVYAVEISPNFLDHLRKRASQEAPRSVRVVEGTERSVALAEASIDLAFICDVYHHFSHPDDSLASLREAIRPGGSLVLIDFERIPGESPEWLLEHVRAGREVFRAEIESAGFVFAEEVELEGLEDNYFLRFDRVD